MQDIDLFLPDVLTYAKGLPDPVAHRFLRQAAREFCERTLLWKEEDEFDVVTPECEAVITMPDADIVRIDAAKLDGTPLEPVTPGWLDENFRDWASDTETATARYVSQIRPNTITLYPRQAGTLTARLILKPSRDALQFPDFLLDHAELIGKGAAAEALLMPNEDWTNPQLAMALRSGTPGTNGFERGLDRTLANAARGQQKAPRRSKASYF